MGVPIGDQRLCTLHFAGDQVILAKDEMNICYMLRKVEEEYSKCSTIILLKTEHLVVDGKSEGFRIGDGVIKGTENMNYLGVQSKINCGK